MGAVCDVFWGSHACDLPADHAEEKHLCGDPNDEDGPCSRLRIDADGIGWIEHWSYLANDPEKRASWDEPSEFPWARLTPIEPPLPPTPATTPDSLRAVLCQDGQITVGLTTYACSGSAHISGYRVVCTSPAHDLPTVPLIVGSTITLGPGRPFVISSFGVTPR